MKSVRPSGVQDVYDLTVPGVHSFVANGIVSHNTGRLAALDPPLHNIKNEPVLKLIFRPTPGYLAAVSDFGQIEPRQAAVLSGCAELKKACCEGDLYRAMSAILNKKRVEMVTPPERKLMKVGVLAAILYMEGEEPFARRQKLALHEVHDFFKACQRRFKEVVEYQQSIIAAARRGDPIETVFGRVATFQYVGDRMLDRHTDIKAVNFTIQSPSSDMCCDRAEYAQREVWKNGPVRIVNLQHDSHWLEVLSERADELLARHKALMEDVSGYSHIKDVPFPVEVKVGPDFGRLKLWTPEMMLA